MKQSWCEDKLGSLDVAPRAGAWIETIYSEELTGKNRMSRPARARGLKLFSIATEISE